MKTKKRQCRVPLEQFVLPVGYYRHSNLGVVEIDDDCFMLQLMNPDKACSIFVLHDGAAKEVTKSLIRPLMELL